MADLIAEMSEESQAHGDLDRQSESDRLESHGEGRPAGHAGVPSLDRHRSTPHSSDPEARPSAAEPVGAMFWFRWKTLSGSMASLRAVSLASFSGG